MFQMISTRGGEWGGPPAGAGHPDRAPRWAQGKGQGMFLEEYSGFQRLNKLLLFIYYLMFIIIKAHNSFINDHKAH